MTRNQRRLHLWLWLVIGPAILVLLWLGLDARPNQPASSSVSEAHSEAAP